MLTLFMEFHLTSTLYEHIQEFVHLLTSGQLLEKHLKNVRMYNKEFLVEAKKLLG